MFVDSVRGFKERYYVVKPVSQLAVDSLFETELDVEEDGAVRRDEEGNEMTR
ncbi:hypothetical protein A2U01_0118250, partial [Trifolium medium]|nr:hypothetical protein [Trifolium medium]